MTPRPWARVSRTLFRMCWCAALACGCGTREDDVDATASDAAADEMADAHATDDASDDGRSAAPACADLETRPCEVCVGGAWQPKTCDDENPCTADSCDPVSGCVWQPVDASCKSSDLCRVNPRCEGGQCKTDGKPCDDGLDCTDNGCNPKTGACTFKTNNHEYCLPVITVTTPPKDGPAALVEGKVLLAGKITCVEGAVASVEIADSATQVNADGSFATWLAMDAPVRVLQLKAKDSVGGEGKAIRVVQTAKAWLTPGASGVKVSAAAALGWGPDAAAANAAKGASEGEGSLAAFLPAQVSAKPLLAEGKTTLALAPAVVSGSLSQGGALLSVDVKPVSAPVGGSAPPSSAIPGAAQPVVAPSIQSASSTALVVGWDAINAMLWLRWWLGDFDGSLMPVLTKAGLASLVTNATQTATLPPWVGARADGSPYVVLGAFDLTLDLGALRAGGMGWVQLAGTAGLTVSCSAQEVRLFAAAPTSIATRVKSNSTHTDAAVQADGIFAAVVLAPYIAAWTASPLWSMPLPAALANATQCELTPAGLRIEGK